MRASTGFKTGVVDNWVIKFRLRGDTQAEITTAVQAMYNAFSVDGRDIVLLDNNGNNSAFVTNSSSTTSGVRINSIEFPDLVDAQYTTYIDGMITADAETVTNISATLLFSETFQVIGNGGPKVVILETARGLPIKQQTRQRTKVMARQTGTSRAFDVPRTPVILFPNLLINEQVEESTTASIEGGKIVYTTSWSYPYQDVNYFSGTPQVRL
jgi:hypothetical protein